MDEKEVARMPKCYFICTNGFDEAPILPLEIPVPAVGSLFFFERESHGYRVVDVQYQLQKEAHHELIMVNVMVKRVTR